MAIALRDNNTILGNNLMLDVEVTDPLDYMRKRGSVYLDKTDFYNAGDIWVKGTVTSVRETGLENVINYYNRLAKANRLYNGINPKAYFHLTNNFFLLETTNDSYNTLRIKDVETGIYTSYLNVRFIALYHFRRSADFDYGACGFERLAFIKGKKNFWLDNPIIIEEITSKHDTVIETNDECIYDCDTHYQDVLDYNQVRSVIYDRYVEYVL